ncbi:unnamed protein product, partial [Lampetra fluviatilis]
MVYRQGPVSTNPVSTTLSAVTQRIFTCRPQGREAAMVSPVTVVKSCGPKLVPFFKTTCIYFVLWLPASSASWFSTLIKCLPILCLCAFVAAHGMSLRAPVHAYARRILAGLVFSALGDACLVWEAYGYFEPGHADVRHGARFLPGGVRLPAAPLSPGPGAGRERGGHLRPHVPLPAVGAHAGAAGRLLLPHHRHDVARRGPSGPPLDVEPDVRVRGGGAVRGLRPGAGRRQVLHAACGGARLRHEHLLPSADVHRALRRRLPRRRRRRRGRLGQTGRRRRGRRRPRAAAVVAVPTRRRRRRRRRRPRGAAPARRLVGSI